MLLDVQQPANNPAVIKRRHSEEVAHTQQSRADRVACGDAAADKGGGWLGGGGGGVHFKQAGPLMLRANKKTKIVLL